MSVLNFPRIYFKGHMFWNPPTGNNNDMMPLYDAVNMQMNWDFLKQYDITPENAPQTLIPWMIQYQKLSSAPESVIQAPPNAGADGIVPAEWDLFGDNGCGTVSYGDTVSTIIGGELPGGGYVDNDPLIATPYNLYGNPFGSNTPTPARFVDVSPWQNTFTALYFDRLVLGNDKCGLNATRQYRMLERFLNFNWASFGGLIYVTATWQTCFPKANLNWLIGDSLLLKNLHDQMEQQNAQGLMFRFCSYLTSYDMNGVFNDQPEVSAKNDPDLLQQLYKKGLENPADIFFNPAYGCSSGVLGLWHENEYPTAPADRRLVAETAVAVPPSYNLRPKSVELGVISAQVHDNVLSLDLMNSFPFIPGPAQPGIDPRIPQPQRLDLGAFDVGTYQGSTFVPVVPFDYSNYQQSAFDHQSGILDLPLTPAQVTQLTGTAPLAVRQQGAQLPTSLQQTWTAEVIESGSFVDVGETKTLTIMVQKNGKPAANLDLLVAEYNNPYLLGTSSYYLGTRDDPNFVLFNDYPDNRAQNVENFPQFEDSPDVMALATEGAGRKLMAFVETQAKVAPLPVYYHDYRTTCSGVNLGACLRFEDREPSVIRKLKPDGQPVEYDYKRITTDSNGIAKVTVTGVSPGFPTLRFYPDEDGTADIVFSFNYLTAYVDFLAPIRVLPSEDNLKQQFVDQWNKVYQQKDSGQAIWDSFIYPQIFEIYYYLYPIMNKYMPLNNLTRIEGAVDQLIRLVSKAYQEESTLAMPITRDMPQGRRAVLELWAQKLVQQKYPPMPLSMADYDNLNIQ